MAVGQFRTRRQLRVHVLRGLGVLFEGTASAIPAAPTTSIEDNSLSLGAADDHKGKYVYFTSTNNANVIRRITTSSLTSNITKLTWVTAVGTNVAVNDAYQLIDGVHPDQCHDAINQAIIEATGFYFDPVENISLHADGKQARFDVPVTGTGGLQMVTDVQYRARVTSVQIHNADTDWNEQAVTNVTRVLDTKDRKQGSGAVKFTIAGAFTTGVIGSKAITALDLSEYDYVEFWVKSSTATVSGDFTLLLDDTALAVSALETLTIPALVANVWTYVRVALANPQLDTAIISVALNAANNIAANVLWIDDVKAVKNDTAVWRSLPLAVWSLDQEAADLILERAGVGLAGYALLKLIGGDKPPLLAADTDATEVPDDFVIARASALLLRSGLGMPSLDHAGRMAEAARYDAMAAYAKRSFALPANTRLVN